MSNGTKILDAAKRYVAMGLFPVPIMSGTKKPAGGKEWQNQRITARELPKHFSNGNQIGLLLGVGPKILADVDFDRPEALAAAQKISGPKTDRVQGHESNPSSHMFFIVDREFETNKFIDPTVIEKGTKATIIELRGGSAKGTPMQTVTAPSVHESGEPIRWEREGDFGHATVDELSRYVSKIAAAALIGKYWPTAATPRFEATWALAGMLSVAGWLEAEVVEFVSAVFAAANDDKFGEREKVIRETCQKVANGDHTVTQRKKLVEVLKSTIVKTFEKWLDVKRVVSVSDKDLTDHGNANLIITKHGEHIRYCSEEHGRWYIADAMTERWHADRVVGIKELAEQVMEENFDRVSASRDKHLIGHALASLDARSINRCVSIASHRTEVAILPGTFDRDPLLLGVENGILDLNTDELLGGRLDMLVSKCASVSFDPLATCAEFDRFLERVQPDRDVRGLLQQFAGLALTDYQFEPCMLFFYGKGANGKSVFIYVLRAVIGEDYGFSGKKDLFFSRDTRKVGDNDLIDIEGKRFVTATEADEGGGTPRWNVGMIKTLIGGETVHGRQLYQVARNFIPHPKIIVSMNLEPRLDSFGEALARRFLKVPWLVTIPEAERIEPAERFAKQLLADNNGAGILNWALEGLRQVREQKWKLDVPKVLRESTAEYFEQADHVKRFTNEWCQKTSTTKDNWNYVDELHRAFHIWLNDYAAVKFWPVRRFNKELKRVVGEAMWRQGHANRAQINNLSLTESAKEQISAKETKTEF